MQLGSVYSFPNKIMIFWSHLAMGLGCELDEITTFSLCGPKLLKFWRIEKGEAGLKELERKGSVVVQENLVAIEVLILLRITDGTRENYF